VIAARLGACGEFPALATRDAPTAARLRASGLQVSGLGGPVAVGAPRVAPLDAYGGGEAFDLVLLATKAQDALAAAPRAAALLARGGALLAIQNGGVARLLAERVGGDRVLGGLSNLGATMLAPGAYEQRNAGHLLLGELGGGESERARRAGAWLGRGVPVRVTANVDGAIWSKLLLNCSVTTLGALAGRTMRGYVGTPAGRAAFDRAYDEALAVALASGARPERMLVDPVPPGWAGRSVPSEAHEAWVARILAAYGDLKPSMLQDLERGRATEIDFQNGHVVALGRRLGVPTPVNAAIVETVHELEAGALAPDPALLGRLLAAGR
jgi:2-dehydropantoate 2-reductase